MPVAETYATATVADIEGLSEADLATLFSSVMQNSMDTVRRSVDGTLCVLKWDGDDPCTPLGVSHTTYTHAEILAEMAKAAWTPVME